MEIIPGLFKSESGKICAVLSRYLGISNLDIAEDLTSETFLAALETWPYEGAPENPTAWLYVVAKNKAWNFLLREHKFNSHIMPRLKAGIDAELQPEPDLSDTNIADSQLQMLFAICHPAIPPESQIGLALRILCGFGIQEIANAFLTNKETINKRLFRAKNKLRELDITIGLPVPEVLHERLSAVMKILYLMFNEGYYSESDDQIIKNELAAEAMRLTELLISNETMSTPAVKALMALMCFQASRFAARTAEPGKILLYDEQDESRWNQQLISRGVDWLNQSSTGETYTTYHLEATIAFWHTQKSGLVQKWENILQLYNRLLELQYTPVAALNRTYALYRCTDAKVAIKEALKLKLEGNRFYHSLLGELYTGIDMQLAADHFEKAINLTNSSSEKAVLIKKLKSCSQPD